MKVYDINLGTPLNRILSKSDTTFCTFKWPKRFPPSPSSSLDYANIVRPNTVLLPGVVAAKTYWAAHPERPPPPTNDDYDDGYVVVHRTTSTPWLAVLKYGSQFQLIISDKWNERLLFIRIGGSNSSSILCLLVLSREWTAAVAFQGFVREKV